ncbi:hypothetical protein M501DRAFT_987403 [Patellaria atrata CBS 101060]|uniref:Protein transport protein SEC9 n=1 Tax=Patellaria atrata CBS 101060 TaxID=1346257 RepID=A0A9P4S4Y8_9PEZI|nr:hypothetical protein M501DRAFT_987403 [Patellaria atrata CBS 101060]
MKKFGFKKKDKDTSSTPSLDEDSRSSSLFSSRTSKSKSPAGSNNPYAQPAANDPYGGQPSPYAKPDQNPPPYDGSNDRFRQEKSPVPPGGYGSERYAAPSSGYGTPTGYGNDRYGGGSEASSTTGSRYGAGGYGGLGRANSQQNTPSTETTAHDDRFGNTTQRQQQQGVGLEQDSGRGPSYGTEGQGGYGAYQDRQLTAEEEEEEDVQASKQQIRFMKQQDVSSTRNALRLAAQAEEQGRSTLTRLAEQGERIHNTEKNLDLASHQNRLAEDKARELKTLNRSMFAVHMKNPFTATSRRAERDAEIMESHHRERAERDATREAAYQTASRHNQSSRSLAGSSQQQQRSKAASLAERAKYQFEADSEDEDMENEIDANLDALHGAAGRLKGLSLAMGREVDEQNGHIDRITGKTDRVDDQIAMNRAKLERISRRG